MTPHDSGTDDERRASQIAERASHDSVTAALLAGSGRFANEFYLYDRPAVAHLDDGEIPHFAFYNEMKGIGVDDKRNTRTPDESGITIVLLTDRRVLALIGRRDGDQRLTVPYDVVTDADYSTGLMKHRLVVTTVDTDYHFWVDSGYGEADLRAAVELVEDQRSGGEATAGDTGDTARVSGDGGADDPASLAGSEEAGQDAGREGTGTPGGRTAPTGSDRGAGDPAGSGSAGGEEDPLDKLERLKELNEKGVLTDEEFERKKADLLDQI